MRNHPGVRKRGAGWKFAGATRGELKSTSFGVPRAKWCVLLMQNKEKEGDARDLLGSWRRGIDLGSRVCWDGIDLGIGVV